MARKLFISGLGVSLVAAVVVGVSIASASSGSGARAWGAPAGMVHFSKVAPAATSGDSTVTVLSKNQKETDVDEPPSGFSQGDEATISGPLTNPAGTRVGHLDVHGAFTAVFSKRQVARGLFTFTATLAGGQIAATGTGTFSNQTNGFTAAITGGTGAYRTTDGWVSVTFTSQTTTTFVYHLTD